MPTRLIENPTVWATEILARNWERISKHVEADWMPVFDTVTSKGAEIIAEVKEYGCGIYGCVMATIDQDVVFKITSDVSEVEFIEKVIPMLGDEPPPGIVEYVAQPLRLEGTYRGGPVFGVWREEAYDVGELNTVLHGSALELIERVISLQQKAGTAAYVVLEKCDDRETVYKDALGLRSEMLANFDTIDSGMSPWVKWQRNYKEEPATHLAMAMALHERCNEFLAGNEHVGVVARTLLDCLEHGVLIADVHPGNIGRVDRGDGRSLWVITDPGNVGVLGTPWRPRGAPLRPPVVTMDGKSFDPTWGGTPHPPTARTVRDSGWMRRPPTSRVNPAKPWDQLDIDRDADQKRLLRRLLDLEFKYGADEAAVREDTIDPYTFGVLYHAGHLRRRPDGLIALTERGSDLAFEQYKEAIREDYSNQPPGRWRQNPSPVPVELDLEYIKELKTARGERKNFLRGAAEKVQEAAERVAASGRAVDGYVLLTDVAQDLGMPIERLATNLAHWDQVDWIELAEIDGPAAIEITTPKRRRASAVNAIAVDDETPGSAAAPTPARAQRFDPNSQADAARFEAVAKQIADAGGGFVGSRKVFLASVTDALGTTVAAMGPALEAWRRAGWIELNRNDLPLPQYYELAARSEFGDIGTTRVVHFINTDPPGRMRRNPGDFYSDFDAAFDAAPGHRHNYVLLADLREAMPQYPRDVFDRGINDLRRARRYALDSADGRHQRLTTAQTDAGIREAGSVLVYAARRPSSEWKPVTSTLGLAAAPAPARSAVPAGSAPARRDLQADFDTAFRASPGFDRNYVLIADLRDRMPQYTREEFDRGWRGLVKMGRYTGDAADGRHVRLTREQLAGGYTDGGGTVHYASRR